MGDDTTLGVCSMTIRLPLWLVTKYPLGGNTMYRMFRCFGLGCSNEATPTGANVFTFAPWWSPAHGAPLSFALVLSYPGDPLISLTEDIGNPDHPRHFLVGLRSIGVRFGMVFGWGAPSKNDSQPTSESSE